MEVVLLGVAVLASAAHVSPSTLQSSQGRLSNGVEAVTAYADPAVPGSLQRCVDAVTHPSDRCLLEPGRYSVGTAGPIVVSNKNGSTIAAAGGGDVVLDGTTGVVSEGWSRVPGTQPVYVTQLPLGAQAIQLFVDGEMQVPARWPNAKFSDKTMYFGPEYWAHSRAGGEHNVTTGAGVVLDAGPCPNASACCSYCSNFSLAASGVNATGAMAILNMWADGVGVQQIASHTPGTDVLHYNATWCKDEIARRGKCADGFRGGLGKYYLEGTLALLDAPTEWYFNNVTGKLFVYLEGGDSPSTHTVRYKDARSAIAFDFRNASHVTLANISFFATALRAYDDDAATGDPRVHSFVFDSLQFDFPSASWRMLGDPWMAETMLVWTDSKKVATNHTFVNCAWRYADGGAQVVSGGGMRFDNCVWEWNSWTAFCSSSPDPTAGDCGTLVVNGAAPPNAPMFRRLRFSFNGASKCLRPPHEPGVRIELVHFEGQLQLADDGCMVETGSETSANMTMNWCHDSGKSALRFDGDDASGTANGIMAYNVGWNISQLTVKGDNHTVTNNIVFDASDIGASWAQRTFPRFQDNARADLDNLGNPACSIEVENPGATTKTADTRSTFANNVFERVANWKECSNVSQCPFAGHWGNNVVAASTATSATPAVPYTPFKIREQLRDPWGRDFRVCPSTVTARVNAGAYPVYSGSDREYWIPGAFMPAASQPSPRDGMLGTMLDADLLFLPAYRAVEHNVYTGTAPSNLQHLVTLHGQANVAQLPTELRPNTVYYWRVDATLRDGSVAAGAVWSFTTGGHRSCPPVPPPTPPPTVSPKCEHALEACCGDVKGQQDPCLHHCFRHNNTLVPAGCTLADEKEFCGL